MNKSTLKYAIHSTLYSIIIFSSAAHAATLCEYGRLSFFQHAGGAKSEILVAVTQGSAGYSALKYKTGVTYATQMWQKNSDLRWANRLSLLSQAHATQSKVSIYSSDENCMGPIDEFEITLLD